MKANFQVLFWVVVLILLVFIFRNYFNSLSESFYFVSMQMPVIVATSYFFNLFLVPRYLLPGRYVKFALYTLYMIIVSLYLEMVVIIVSLILLAAYSYSNMSPVSSDIFVLTITLYFFVLLFTFIHFTTRRKQDMLAISNLEDQKEKLIKDSFSVRSDRQMRSIRYDEVIMIESMADYVKINLKDGSTVITKEPISKLTARLPELFIRVHRSYLVNRSFISSFSKEEIFIGNIPVPVSRTYRADVWHTLGGDVGKG